MLLRTRTIARVVAALGTSALFVGGAFAADDFPVDQLPSSSPNSPMQYSSAPDAYEAPQFTRPQWNGPWDPAGWVGYYGCPVPTVQECMTPQWATSACGGLDAWARTNWPGGSPCEFVLGNIFSAWAAQNQFPQKQDVRGDGSQYVFTDVPQQLETSYFYHGAPTTFLDESLLNALEVKNPAALVNSRIPSTRPRAVKRAEWEANGAAVGSCREYVWEKWYDWSRFEDDTAGVDGDFGRYAFNRAFDPTSGISARVIRSRDGAPQRQVSFPADPLPKNAYFLFERTPFDMYPFDATTLPSAAGRGVYTASWAWHQGMSTALASTPDASLTYEYQRQLSFKKLLAKRVEVLAALFAEAGGSTPMFPAPSVGSSVPLAVAAKFADDSSAMSGYSTSSSGRAAAAVATLPSSAIGGVIGAHATAVAVQTIIDPLAGKYVAVDTGGYTGKMAQLYLLDKSIAAYLTHARDTGCLALGTPAACDWSPELFADQIRGQFAAERDTDYQTCVDKTGDDFSASAMIHNPGAFGVPSAIPGLDYAKDSESVRAFFAIYDLFVRDYLVFSPEPGSVTKPAKGWWKYDLKSYGNSDWNMGYEYKLGWGLQKNSGARAGLCDTDIRVQGMAKASAMLAGKAFDVLDGDNYAYSQDGVFHLHSHLKVLGKAIYDTGEPTYSTVHYAPLNYKLSAKPSLSSTIVVVYIPVTIEVGVSGEAGIATAIDASVMRSCPTSGAPAFGISVGATLTPFVHVAGFGSVGVGVPGFQAKLVVELDLLQLDVPFSVTASLAPTTTAMTSLQLNVTAKLDLVLKTLSGRVLGVLENPIKDLSATLFSWPGLELLKETGWSRTWKVPVASVLAEISR